MGKKYDAPEAPDYDKLLELTQESYQLQSELVQQAMDWFDVQFDEQRAIQQPVIDQQLETLIQQSDFAKAQQDRYLSEGVPAQQAAAQALTDLAQTPEGQKFVSDLNDAFAASGNTDGEQAFRAALSNYGISAAEQDYLTSLSSYEDPQVLQQKLVAATEYQDPAALKTAITNLQNFDSTARVREAEGVAAADVRASGEAARTAAMQQLESYGIDPSQLASGALDRSLRAQTDAQAALAASQARRGIQAQGLSADVQAAQLATDSATRELQTQIAAAEGLMQSRIRELQMQGMSAEEARTQADREIGYSQLYAQMEAAQRSEQLGYSQAASTEANQQQAREAAAKIDAYNIYAGNPATSATAFGTAGSAGGQAAGIAGQQTATGLGAYGTFSNMYGNAIAAPIAGYNTANSIYGNQIASAQAEAASNAGPWSLLGTVAGTALGGWGSGGFKFAEGGAVPPVASPSRGAIPDDIPARVSAGEFIMPEDVVRWFGEEKLTKMIEKSRADRAGPASGKSALPPSPAQPAIPMR